METSISKSGRPQPSDELYLNALKEEGFNPEADGLLTTLRDMHMDALSPSMVDRAYSAWKKARRAHEAKKQKGQP